MNAKRKIFLTGAVLLAIAAPAYFQYHQIGELRSELEAERAGHGTVASSREITRLKNEIARLTRERANGSTASSPSPAAANPFLSGGRTQPPLVSANGGDTTGTADAAQVAESPELPAIPYRPMTANGKVHWDHSQATGAPDTTTAGDHPTAWAPKGVKSGEQWLQLTYPKAMELKEINIHETHAPGAVSKVTAMMPNGSEKVLWEGRENPTGEEIIESSIPVPAGVTSKQIKVYVDTNRVESWPEIDAVEMVGRTGARQWASESTASSSYSERYGEQSVTNFESLRLSLPSQ